MTQTEYVKKLIEKLEQEQKEKESKLKEKIMPRPKNRKYNNTRRRNKRYNAEDHGFSPAEVVVENGNVIRAYKRLQRILEKDGTLKQYKSRRRFDRELHKNQKR